MKNQIGERIKSARKLAGFSLRELSTKVDGIVSHNAISKYEKGTMLPDGKVLIALSHALNVKTEYFLRPKSVEISNIEFRKKSKLTSKQISSIKERIIDILERYIELEGFLGIKTEFQNPVKHLKIQNGNDVEEAVNKLLNHWDLGINAIPNVIELLEDNEIKVIELDDVNNFDGLSGVANENIPIIVLNNSFTVERKRFTALHELGHLLLNFDPVLSHKDIEKLCHRFAGAVLLPKETIYSELGKRRNSISINELQLIKESYGISIQAIMARAKDLEIISSDQFIRFRKWINKSEARKMELGMGQFAGDENSSRFKQLVYRATAEEVISMSKAASLSNIKLAEFRDEFFAI